MITLQELEHWFPATQKQALLTQLKQVVGLTRVRAEYFLRLWIYLLVKAKLTQQPQLRPPLTELQTQFGAVICTTGRRQNCSMAIRKKAAIARQV